MAKKKPKQKTLSVEKIVKINNGAWKKMLKKSDILTDRIYFGSAETK